MVEERGFRTSEFKFSALAVLAMIANLFIEAHYGVEGLSETEMAMLFGMVGLYNYSRYDLKKTIAKNGTNLKPLQPQYTEPQGPAPGGGRVNGVRTG